MSNFLYICDMTQEIDKLRFEETWRKVEGFDYYEVSSYGNYRSLDHYAWNGRGFYFVKGAEKTSFTKCNGYPIIHFNGKNNLLSRVVAKTFPELCGEWFEGCEVHHKDHNPDNNRADNLLVLSKEEHREIHKNSPLTQIKNEDSRMQVLQYDTLWNFIKCFNSAFEAAEEIKGDIGTLRRACNGNKKSHTYKGFKWLYNK